MGAIFGGTSPRPRAGVFLKRSYSGFRLDQAYLAILLTALLGLLLVLLVNLVERLALRWYYTSRRTSWRGRDLLSGQPSRTKARTFLFLLTADG